MVGQTQVVEPLSIALQASRGRGEPLGHTLLDGPPGLGKTTISRCIAEDMGTEPHELNATTVSKTADIVPVLSRLAKGDVLFIDEIHRLPTKVEEFLYPCMEDYQARLLVSGRAVCMSLHPFTLVGATTRAGLLTKPFQDRFINRYSLKWYGHKDLGQIAKLSAVKLKVKITDQAAQHLARVSRGTPRLVNNYLRAARDRDDYITLEVIQDTLLALGVDEHGLRGLDYQYLTALREIFKGGPTGIRAIAAATAIDIDTLLYEVEPFLLQTGHITLTPRGRMLCVKKR